MTTAFDPYAVLGVARVASAGAIKAAYRKRVRHAHPDRGGNPEDFIVIVRAFGLLSDPEMRRIFDETGIVDIESLKTYRHDVTAVLADMFDAAVQSAVAAGLRLTQVDFIDLMGSAVDKGKAETSSQARRLEGEIAGLKALRQRIKRNDDNENLFVERLNAQVLAKTEQHDALRRRLFILETASVELGNYESDVELISALEVAP
jgi:curved DNA-binding protein CbpA